MVKRLYSKAPIEEALIDIQIDPTLQADKIVLDNLDKILKNDFSDKKDIKTANVRLEFKDGVPSKIEDKGVVGFQYWTTDKKFVSQVRYDGFTFSRLRPYESWETFLPLFKKYWETYRSNLTPKNIKRIAVRYINIIDIPHTQFKLEDYFIGAPAPPPNSPQELEGFLSRLVIKLDESRKAITTLTIQEGFSSVSTRVLLDIGIVGNTNLEAANPSLTDILTKYHGSAEDIFESFITDKTRRLFE